MFIDELPGWARAELKAGRVARLAYLDDTGMLHWGGRVSNMIRTAGVNVSPVEIESKLSLWGRLKVAAVVPIPHPRLDEAVVLCAVPHHDDAVRPEDVVGHLRTVQASYKVPKRVLIVDEDDLTHTSSGEKLKTTDLKRLASSEEVARATLFLASDLASAVTGQMLTVDCGEFHS